MKILKVLILSAILISGPLVSFGMDAGSSGSIDYYRPFEQAVDFTLSDLSGNKVSLSEFIGKKVILLTFWNSQCKLCRREASLLKEIYAKYNSRGVEILAVNVWESPARTDRFREEKNIPYRILLDSDDMVNTIYGVRGVPTDIIIDKKGKLQYYFFVWPDNLEEIIEKLLK